MDHFLGKDRPYADLSTREVRALEMFRSGARASQASFAGEFLVPSQHGNGFYRVRGVGADHQQETCDCPDFLDRHVPCKHIFFARRWILDSIEAKAELLPRDSTRKIPVNWSIYTQCQKEEGRLFPILLRELCAGIQEVARDPNKAGRPPIPLRDQVFCAISKVYAGSSCRRSHNSRVVAAANGLIESVPHWGLTSEIMCRPETTALLIDMLARSVLPLRPIESRCAVDLTGFRTTGFHYYRKEKYNPKRENIWLKAHALVGARTHAILSLDISDGNAGDSPRFPLLLERAVNGGFNLREVLADKAYNSRKNFDVAEDLGIVPLIPFKSNQTGQSKGSAAYRRMFLFFTYHRDEFDAIYGDRAQVESAFGSIKQVLGETIASRNFDAQVNELFCMAIAHNVRMLIHAMLELSILPDFLASTQRPASDSPVGFPDTARPLLSVNSPPTETAVVLSNSLE